MADVLRSLDGRYFGRDALGYHVAFTGLKAPDIKVGASGSELSVLGANSVQTMLTASTATQIKPAGTVILAATAAKDFGMAAPVPGSGPIWIIGNGGTTLAQTITLAAGTIQTTAGSTCNKISMDNDGDVIGLIPLTTAEFGLLSKSTATVLSTA